MPRHGLGPCAARHPAQHESHDDGVIGVSQHRDDVGDQVERQGQIGRQQGQADAHTAADIRICGQSLGYCTKVVPPAGFEYADPPFSKLGYDQ